MPGPSASTSFYQTVYDSNISSNNSTDCTNKKTAYNSSLRTVNTNLNNLRDGNCLPDNTKYAEEIEQNAQDKAKLISRFEEQERIFNSYMESVDTLQNARGPFDTYMTEMKAEMDKLTQENYDLQQSIRAGRRRFMDAQPQGGVGSFLGLKTSDNRVLFMFWIAFVAGIVALELVLLLQFGAALGIETTQQKITVIVAGLAIATGIAYTAIRRFA